jgi:hypothetical protein
MKVHHAVPLRVPAERVNLEKWIFTLSDEEYQAASRVHRAAGVTVSDGVRGTVNVEILGGTLVIQHYREVSSTPAGFELYSPRSRGYVFHLVPIRIAVRWTMSAERRSAQETILHCTVELTLSPLLRLLSILIGTGWFLRRHVREEALGFARDIERKYAPPDADPV